MAHWYCSSGSNSPRVGPLDDNAAHAHAQQHPEDLCWRDGMAAWKPVGGVLELAPSANVPPPSMPALPSTGSGRGQADEIDYRIVGGDMQFVEIELDPGESAISEAGALMYKDSAVQMDTVFGDGSHAGPDGGRFEIGSASCRERVGQYG